MRIYLCAAGLLTAIGAMAWQSSLASLKLTRETFERQVTNYVQNSVNSSGGSMQEPGMGRAGAQALLAMDDATRATVVKELSLAAKAFVMSPAFAASYDAYLKTSRNAVNHGVAIKDTEAEMRAAAKSTDMAAVQAATNNMMRDSYRKSVMQRLDSIAKLDKQVLEMMASADVQMMDASMPSTAEEKANVAKAKTMLKEATQQAASDIVKARATYKSALMLAAGLGGDAQVAAGLDAEKKREQQLNYNRLLLKPALKNRLQDFLAIARTVDFKAPTVMKGGKKLFVDRAFESKSGFWKMLYRLGPGGTGAAVAVAQGWIAEL